MPSLDRKALGRCVLDYTHAALAKAGAAIAAAERTRGAVSSSAASSSSSSSSSSSGPVMHIRYADNVRDPVSVCRAVFARAGMTDPRQTEEWERRVAAYLEKNKAERAAKRGKEKALHSYSLEDYGLTEQGVRERFKEYTDRYNLVADK